MSLSTGMFTSRAASDTFCETVGTGPMVLLNHLSVVPCVQLKLMPAQLASSWGSVLVTASQRRRRYSPVSATCSGPAQVSNGEPEMDAVALSIRVRFRLNVGV